MKSPWGFRRRMNGLKRFARMLLDFAAIAAAAKIFLPFMLFRSGTIMVLALGLVVSICLHSRYRVPRWLAYAAIAALSIVGIDTAYAFGRLILAYSLRNSIIAVLVGMVAGIAWWRVGSRVLNHVVILSAFILTTAAATATQRDTADPKWLTQDPPRGASTIYKSPQSPSRHKPSLLLKIFWPHRVHMPTTPRNIAFAPDESAVYLSLSGNDYADVLRIDLQHTTHNNLSTDCRTMLPRDMAYDTGAGKLYVADHTLGRVLVLQGDTMVCDNHNVRGMDYTNAQNLLLDDERGYLIMVTEPGLLLRNTGDSVKKLDLRAWPQEIVYNQRNAALYAVGSTGLRRLLRVDVENMQITAKRFIHSYVWGIAGDFKANRIFAARCNLGDVLVYDADTLEKIARIPVATGLRAMIYDPIRDYLYVGSYIDGTVHVVDCADYSKLGEIKLWPQIRDMDLGPVSNDLYVDCVTGLFRIEPERALRIK